MTSVYYYHLKEFPDDQFNDYLELLPPSYWPYILKYRDFKDKKRKLLARLMVLYALRMDHAEHLINKWTVSSLGKPHIPGWKNFCISHSGNWVILICSNNLIGIDVEVVDIKLYTDIVVLLHKDEQEYINNAEDKATAFCKIWTRKEAVLKAIGTGLIDQLDVFSCVQQEVTYQEKAWYFSNIKLDAEHICTACTETKEPKFEISLLNSKDIAS
ncbi:4'-phosphopantetheinyl transferase family protein [Mucilaginibacter sp. KACC 22063]|uniref:4'-phosphopantetheinyl transferase family protein n=1 Tax=Mucilaginibacter sp. KACC 22063 TaxID=3025666 RepID=UPI002366E73F|nr:4'-phosphopantetheinyl transferase superfamily protein [Mucilaginibacter sp. KACC 22063]WDF57317.1 4'-phosphopantetheinyl transferase superfamily protein [Mucilaginibacter sp. KACC 22063]